MLQFQIKIALKFYHSEVLRWNEVSYRVVIMLPLSAIKKIIDWLLNMYRELDTSNSIGIKQLLFLWVFRKLKYIAFDESIILTNPKKKSNQCILIMLKKNPYCENTESDPNLIRISMSCEVLSRQRGKFRSILNHGRNNDAIGHVELEGIC